MTTPAKTQIRCASCGQPFPVAVRTLLDVQNDPQGKALLMASRLNVFDCPHCGFDNNVLTPLLYHDTNKSLLIAFIPMEISLQTGKTEEKIVGDMLNELTRSIPKDQFRAYMFNPKRALTLEGLREQVMEADGISKEMVDEQKKRVELMQSLLAIDDEEKLYQAVEAADERIDEQFFRMLSLMHQRLSQEGRSDVAMAIENLHELLLARSSFGKQAMSAYEGQQQIVQAVAGELNALGEQATRADVRSLALSYAGDNTRLQALVALARPALDYEFFLEFTQAISQAPAAERAAMEAVRDRLNDLTKIVDEQQQAQSQDVVEFLTVLINTPDPDALIEQAGDMIDGNMLRILAANIEEAERRQAMEAAQAMRRVYTKLVDFLDARLPPEMRLLNRLIGAAPDEEAALLNELKQFDVNALLQWCDAMLMELRAGGDSPMLQRLQQVRALIAAQ